MAAKKKMAAVPKGAAATKPKPKAKAPAKASKPQNREIDASPKLPVRVDPDTELSSELGPMLAKELKRRNISLGASECGVIAFALVLSFLKSRAAAWSRERPIRMIGDPDAETVGVAETVLSVVAEKAMEAGVDFEKSVGEWSKEDVANFLAIGFLAIRDQRVQSLEVGTIQDDDIPF